MARLTSYLAHLLLASLAVAAPLKTGTEISDAVGDSLTKEDGVVKFRVANADAKNIIPNRYIVVYNDTFDSDTIDAKEASFVAAVKKRNLNKRSSLGHLLSTEVSSFHMNNWRAMALEADDLMMNDIWGSDEVAYVEADTQINLQRGIMQTNAPDGVNRLSSNKPGKSNYVFDDSAGEGITAYVVDTGILVDHSEFEGRATFGANFVDQDDTDKNGHGTHVAGTIGGATFGVSKKVDLVAVKVLDAQGSGSNSGVIKGMQFVIDHAKQKGAIGKAVMNMSLGGQKSEAVNRAIEALFKAGIVPIVAAGNDNVDTANTSPGSAPNAVTVGAINGLDDSRAPFSNFGPDVDIFAPGVKVLSCGIKSKTDQATLSGTSMASPHVAGLAAYLMGYQKITEPGKVVDLLKSLAKQSGAQVQNNAPNTTGLIAWNGSRQ